MAKKNRSAVEIENKVQANDAKCALYRSADPLYAHQLALDRVRATD